MGIELSRANWIQSTNLTASLTLPPIPLTSSQALIAAKQITPEDTPLSDGGCSQIMESWPRWRSMAFSRADSDGHSDRAPPLPP